MSVKDYLTLLSLQRIFHLMIGNIGRLESKTDISTTSQYYWTSKTENVEELVNLYSSADLFMNFSVEETFGLTTVESMAWHTSIGL